MFSPEAYALAEGLVSRAYINQGSQATARRSKLVTSLLSERRLPKDGWDDHSIEAFLSEAAMMDSNNFLDNVGVGEREARVYSPLVARRHWNLAHGIGRSGDVAAEQPKAAGSSLLNKLTNLLVADAMKIAGLEDMGPALVLPLATGMTLTLVLLAMKSKRPKTANKVVWCRLDQKTCVKAVLSAGLEQSSSPRSSSATSCAPTSTPSAPPWKPPALQTSAASSRQPRASRPGPPTRAPTSPRCARRST